MRGDWELMTVACAMIGGGGRGRENGGGGESVEHCSKMQNKSEPYIDKGGKGQERSDARSSILVGTTADRHEQQEALEGKSVKELPEGCWMWRIQLEVIRWHDALRLTFFSE